MIFLNSYLHGPGESGHMIINMNLIDTVVFTSIELSLEDRGSLEVGNI